MQRVQVTDLYEASYYLYTGCTLLGVDCIPIAGKTECCFTFSGYELELVVTEYKEKRAYANLYAFRSAYATITNYVYRAKKNYSEGKKNEWDLDEDGEK